MRIVNIIRSRFTIVLAVFSLMIGGAAFLFAGMASAGTDGQQIEFFNGNSGEVGNLRHRPAGRQCVYGVGYRLAP